MIKIGIVEDEAIIADDLQDLLISMGYACPDPCVNFKTAIAMLQAEAPDLVLLDINLYGKPDGIRIASYIRANLNIPFIFLTANTDADTVAMAKETRPDAYLVKPFQKADLYTAIEIALYNFNYNKRTAPRNSKSALNDTLFIKDGDYFHKVNVDDILYLSSEHVYVTVHTAQRKFLVRTSMQEYLEHFDPSLFVRVHRSHVVNIKQINKINSNCVYIGTDEVPMSKNHREDLLKMLNLS